MKLGKSIEVISLSAAILLLPGCKVGPITIPQIIPVEPTRTPTRLPRYGTPTGTPVPAFPAFVKDCEPESGEHIHRSDEGDIAAIAKNQVILYTRRGDPRTKYPLFPGSIVPPDHDRMWICERVY